MDSGDLLRLFDEHHAALFRFAYRLTGSVSDAEDIVQECFLALLLKGCRYDPRRTPARVYLFGAVRNQAWKRLRGRTAPSENGADPIDVRSPETESIRSEVGDAVAGAVARLPEGQRDALILAHYEQMALTEIAEILEIEVGAVKSRLQRARARLREELAAYAPGGERRP
jgi:RNA polymerase sigma-70 factor (ECF subfamily)